MGNVIRGRFGRARPTDDMSAAYFYAFFDPSLNPWLARQVGKDYKSQFQAYVLEKALGVSSNTVRARAAILQESTMETILGYTEQHALMRLSPVDRSVFALLQHQNSFEKVVGREIMERQEVYGIEERSLPDAAPDHVLDRQEQIRRHLSICAPCKYASDAYAQLRPAYPSDETLIQAATEEARRIASLPDPQRNNLLDRFVRLELDNLLQRIAAREVFVAMLENPSE